VKKITNSIFPERNDGFGASGSPLAAANRCDPSRSPR